MPEGCHEVVYPLDVAACWVADGPDIEDALEGSLGGFVAVEFEVGVCSWDVDTDLVPDCFVEAATSAAVRVGLGGFAARGTAFEGLSDAFEVLFPFTLERRDTPLTACGEVTEKDLPTHGANLLWYTLPGIFAEFGKGDGACLENAFELVDTADSRGQFILLFLCGVGRGCRVIDEVK